MIELKNVSKYYFRQAAVNNLSLTIPSGKIVGVVGENGSGKSTILKLLAGLIRPSKGVITIDNQHVDRRISSRVLTYLSELDVYYSFYTVQETIDFYASQFEDFDLEKANQILEFMRLEPDKQVKNLSKGSRGRLKILISLSRKVPYILMDEPLSGLDPMVRESIIKGLISFIDMDKQTVILTTHELSEIESLLDMVIFVKNGKVLDFKDLEEIRQQENLSLVEWMKRRNKDE